jgi:ABC-type lipoprotein export system ATPase subunit
MIDSRGSIWRKWDLHFHTPSSYDYVNKSVSDVDIINKLIDNGIEVIAVTDHHIIDTVRISELQRLGKDKITILPGIEFRSDIVLSDSLHFIGIFPENSDVEKIWDTLRIKLSIDIDKVYNKIEEPKLSFSLKETTELIHQLGGIVSVHAGTKSNSFEKITNSFSHTQELKRNILLSRYIDFLEIGKLGDVNSYENIVFPNIGINLPIIICSDNHDINNYTIKENLWIKGDPSFINLKQVINQPDRVYLGNKPPGLQIVEDNPTKYIDRIKISKKLDSVLDEVWFNNIDIPLNPGLTAIIGNKGNGKSALTDIIGLCGNTHNYSGFSFLNQQKFRKNKSEKADSFEATIIWKNNKEVLCSLSNDIDIDQEERIKYIPQSYLESLCDSIEGGNFENELKQIIFSHIPQHERLGKNDLEELITHRTQIIRSDIENFKAELSTINSEILFLESKEQPSYLRKLQENLKLKEEELLAHQQSKPSFQELPSNKNDEESEKIVILREEYQQVMSSINAAIDQIGDLKKDIEILDQRKQSFSSLQNEIEHAVLENKNILNKYKIDINSIITFNISTELIDQLIYKKQLEVNSLLEDYDSNGEKYSRKKVIQSEIVEIQSKLDQPAKAYQLYLSNLDNWNHIEKTIIGTIEVEGSIVNIQNTINYIQNSLKRELKDKYLERRTLIQNIFIRKLDITNIYKELYQSVTNFIVQHESLMSSYKISFNTLFRENDLYKRFSSMINFSSIGSFHNISDGMEKIKEFFEENKFETPDDAYSFVKNVLYSLKYDSRKGGRVFSDIKNQLKGGNSPIDIYNFICSLDYLVPTYELRLSEKNVSTLSPGERGALLLIFYLILDNNNVPLVIDQPEENLDNQSVYNILVPFIKMAKLRRQVIIVTHNPNLAVVCDADQIIHIKIDKEDKNTVYIYSGGLENSAIASKILEILEGTIPAFYTRTNTYSLHKYDSTYLS